VKTFRAADDSQVLVTTSCFFYLLKLRSILEANFNAVEEILYLILFLIYNREVLFFFGATYYE